MKKSMYLGLDVHKESIAVAYAIEGDKKEPVFYGNIGGDMASLDRVVKKLADKGHPMKFVYEAGPCGYGICRHLQHKGHACIVVAPGRIPRKAGDRVKTDRRDALTLARLHRSGDLRGIEVPQEVDEAVRDMVRLREDRVEDLRRSRQRLKGFLLRHGKGNSGGTGWTEAYRRWLTGVKMEQAAAQQVLEEYILSVEAASEALVRVEKQLREVLEGWGKKPMVNALQALRGIDWVHGMTLAAELGDLKRFAKARELMGFIGLTPSESSSGQRRQQGGITKAGNGRVRRALVEAAWAYRLPARIGSGLHRRLDSQPKKIRDISWKAQTRLCARYRRLCARGKKSTVAITAIARELAGFVWAIGQAVP